MAPLPLFGRDQEIRVLEALVDRAHESGGALVVRGEAGIGKSALLAAASRSARERGLVVLSASGVQSEAHLPFSGLHQILRPVLPGVEELAPRQRTAILAAFGMTESAAPDLFLIALATLELLSGAAARSPLLLSVDDVQWLDRSTVDVLAFVARRLATEPVVLLAASRDGYESALTEIGLPELRLTELDEEAERVVRPFGARFVLASVQMARGVAALGGGRHAEAYAHLRRLYDPADPAHHHSMKGRSIGDLADAAVRCGRREEARAVLEEVARLAAQTPSPWFQVGLRHARPLLADDEDAEALFRVALRADLRRWPLDRARLLLAYGEWLRRRRRVADSRPPLRAARDTFDALGVLPWGDRARRELRAAGESSRRRTGEARERLTAQELQIARMAADGLANREIGQQLYLSHRTVGAHLYRIFPKLGITARGQLRAALDPASALPVSPATGRPEGRPVA